MKIHDKKKKKRFTRAKFKKTANGAISILLCLIITPFLSISLSLVELARYQEVIAITEEIMELVGISSLSNYDTYLHDRFGLMCTTQEEAIDADAESYLTENAKILGSQIKVENVSVEGKISLLESDGLRQQIVNVSELSIPAAILLKDFNLQEIIDSLNNISQISNTMDMVDKIADVTSALNDTVTSLENLDKALREAQEAINSVVNKANEASTTMASLYSTLSSAGVSLPEDATEEAISAALSTFSNNYKDDLKNAYARVYELVGLIDGAKEKVGAVLPAVEDLQIKVNATRELIDSLSSENTEDLNGDGEADGGNSAAVITTFDEVLSAVEELLNTSLSTIKDETIETAKAALDDIKTITIGDTGIQDVVDQYNHIKNGDYFGSEDADEDLQLLLETVYDVCTDNADLSALETYFKDLFVPSINLNINSIIRDVGTVLEKALEKVGDGVGEELVSLLSRLVNLMKSLFGLNLFFDPELNAFVDVGVAGGVSSGYTDFLKAFSELFNAMLEFTGYNSEDASLWERLKGAWSGMKGMLSAAKKILASVVTIIKDNVSSVFALVGDVFTFDVKGLYEKLLIAGYMRHNFPSRVSAGDYDASMQLELNGEGITGFSYNDIARPNTFAAQVADANKSGFEKLDELINSVASGAGTDTMFKGAELEYIRAGTNSEIANQAIVFLDIYFLRLLVDLPSIFTDPEVTAIAGAATIASWLVYIIYILIEPLCDSLLLVNGVNMELLRNGCWATPTGLSEFITKLAGHMPNEIKDSLNEYSSSYTAKKQADAQAPTTTGGMGYETHVLMILVIFAKEDLMLKHMQDLIELEAEEYYRQQGLTFNMYKTYTALNIEADVTFDSFFDLGSFNGGSPLLPKIKVKQGVSY